MAEAVVAIGLVSTIIDQVTSALRAIQSIQSRLDGSSTPKDVEHNILSAHCALAVCNIKFRNWASTWLLEDPAQLKSGYITLTYLWGNNGWSEINECLENVKDISGRTKERIPVGFEKQIRGRRLLKSFKDKKQAPLLAKEKATELQKEVHDLEVAVDKLFDCSNHAFREMHPSECEMIQPTQTSDDDNHLNIIGSHLFASRKLLESLASSEANCGLNLSKLASSDFSPSNGPIDNQKIYHVWLNTNDAENMSEMHRVVSRRFSQSMQSMQSLRSTNSISATPFQREGAQSWANGDSISDGLKKAFTTYDISSKWQALSEHPFLQFVSTGNGGKKWRCSIAQVIAAAALQLIGTPFLALLESQNITAMAKDGDTFEYVLQAQGSRAEEALRNFSTEIMDPILLNNIGILFLEIALARPCKLSPDNADYNSWSNHVQEMVEVRHLYGADYCEAVAFCLRRRSWNSYCRKETCTYNERNREITCQWARLIEDFRTNVVKRYVKALLILGLH